VNEPTLIIGEAVAGEAQKIRKQINAIINGVNKSTFTLAELLHKVKVTPTLRPEQTFGEYAKGLELKISKSYYLVRIIDNMLISGVPKEIYEPVGIAKLRVISKLDPLAEFEGKPMTQFIKGLVETATSVEINTLKEAVAHLQGQTGDEARVWLNISVGKSQRDNVILPAIENAKKLLGSVATNAEGEPQDASDGRALEIICAAFLADKDNDYEPLAPVTIVSISQADGVGESQL
jgi:hypothetical protein